MQKTQRKTPLWSQDHGASRLLQLWPTSSYSKPSVFLPHLSVQYLKPGPRNWKSWWVAHIPSCPLRAFGCSRNRVYEQCKEGEDFRRSCLPTLTVASAFCLLHKNITQTENLHNRERWRPQVTGSVTSEKEAEDVTCYIGGTQGSRFLSPHFYLNQGNQYQPFEDRNESWLKIFSDDFNSCLIWTRLSIYLATCILYYWLMISVD